MCATETTIRLLCGDFPIFFLNWPPPKPIQFVFSKFDLFLVDANDSARISFNHLNIKKKKTSTFPLQSAMHNPTIGQIAAKRPLKFISADDKFLHKRKSNDNDLLSIFFFFFFIQFTCFCTHSTLHNVSIKCA